MITAPAVRNRRRRQHLRLVIHGRRRRIGRVIIPRPAWLARRVRTTRTRLARRSTRRIRRRKTITFVRRYRSTGTIRITIAIRRSVQARAITAIYPRTNRRVIKIDRNIFFIPARMLVTRAAAANHRPVTRRAIWILIAAGYHKFKRQNIVTPV